LIEAAAAYSLRKLKEDFTGDVVEVRRNVDGETEGFTAAEVTDGTMESFVKGWEEYSLATAKNYTTHSFEEFSSPSSNGFTALNSSAEAFAGWDIPSGSAGDLIEVSFDINIISGTPRVQLRPEYDDRKIRSDIFEIGTSGSYTATLKATGDYSFISFSDGDVPSEFTVSNFKVYNNSVVNELPLDQATGAAAAYSLRNLSSSYTGNVVEVRRSSDDAVKSFTASEVADGTLTDWVNDYQTELSVARNYTSNPYESFTNASSSGFTASNSSGTGFAGFDLSGAPGDEVEVSFELTIRSGSPQIKLRTAYNSSGSASLGTTYTTSGTKTITLTATADFGFIAFSEGDIPADFDVSNFQIVSRSADGHVKTWYDQSGSDNHAVQTDTAKQPKIVENGNLLKSNNTPEVRFDGTDDVLDFTAIEFSTNDWLLSSVVDWDGTDSTIIGGGVAQWLLRVASSNNFSARNTNDSTIHNFDPTTSISTGDGLFTILRSSDALEGYYDGEFDAVAPAIDSTDTFQADRMGLRASAYSSPSVKEIIIYNSDQSDKRRAIEENIANHYDISLEAFSRDGTVSTWYDQSGNTPANDATQTDPTKQPKIVNAGSLVSGGLDFDGVDDYLVTTQGYIVELSQNPASVFCVATPDNTNQGYLLTEGDRISPYSSQFILNGASDGSVTVWVNTVGFGSGFPASKTLGGFIYNGTTFQAYLNGSADGSAGTADINAEVFNQTFIGTRADGTTFFFAGKVEELITYKSDQSDNRTAIEANIGETYSITAIPAANDTVNGFVQTWYDQSGSGNDAEQSAASSQPKIVGEVTSGQPHAFLGAIEFSVSGSFMSASGFAFSPSGDMLISSVQKLSTGQVYDARDGGGDGIFVQQGGSDLRFRYNSDGSVDASGNNDLSLATFEIDGTTMTVYKNGSSAGTDTVVAGLSTTTDFHIGRNSFNLSNYADGKIYEIVAYESDQSANRTAIEANINNQYDIY
jgi:hypothetical protein